MSELTTTSGRSNWRQHLVPQISDDIFCLVNNRFWEKLANSSGCTKLQMQKSFQLQRAPESPLPQTKGTAPGPTVGPHSILTMWSPNSCPGSANDYHCLNFWKTSLFSVLATVYMPYPRLLWTDIGGCFTGHTTIHEFLSPKCQCKIIEVQQ